MKKKITIKTIADMCNVSVGTVDRALNKRGRINTETRSKIIALCEELGYTPNTLARVLASNRRYKILVIIPKEPSDFFSLIKRGMEAAAEEAKKLKFDVEFLSPDRSIPYEQIEIISNLNTEDIDGIIINPASHLLAPYINGFVDKGIPVITFSSDIAESKRLCYIGENVKDAGHVSGELMGKFLNGKGNVIIMTGAENIESHQSRKAWFEKVIRNEYPKIKIIGNYYYNEKEAEADLIIRDLLHTGTDIDGIFVTSSAGTVGVAMAMEKINLELRPVVIGFDAVDYTKQALKDNRLTATICQEPYSQGYYSIKFMIKRLLEGWQPDRCFYYTKLNIALKYHSDIEKIDIDMLGKDSICF